MLIIAATRRAAQLQDFIERLRGEPGTETIVVTAESDVLELAKVRSPELVLIDDGPDGDSSFALAAKLLKINAMINTAVVSPLSEEDFHERSEGMGILARLPPHPGPMDAKLLMEKLRGVLFQGMAR